MGWIKFVDDNIYIFLFVAEWEKIWKVKTDSNILVKNIDLSY